MFFLAIFRKKMYLCSETFTFCLMKKLFVLLLASAALLSACKSDKDSAKESLNALYEDVQANGDSYTDADWHKFLVEYQRTDSILGCCELTDEERQEVGRVKGKCAAYLLKAKAKEAGSKLKEAGQELKGMVEGFVEGMQEGNN